MKLKRRICNPHQYQSEIVCCSKGATIGTKGMAERREREKKTMKILEIFTKCTRQSWCKNKRGNKWYTKSFGMGWGRMGSEALVNLARRFNTSRLSGRPNTHRIPLVTREPCQPPQSTSGQDVLRPKHSANIQDDRTDIGVDMIIK